MTSQWCMNRCTQSWNQRTCFSDWITTDHKRCMLIQRFLFNISAIFSFTLQLVITHSLFYCKFPTVVQDEHVSKAAGRFCVQSCQQVQHLRAEWLIFFLIFSGHAQPVINLQREHALMFPLFLDRKSLFMVYYSSHSLFSKCEILCTNGMTNTVNGHFWKCNFLLKI